MYFTFLVSRSLVRELLFCCWSIAYIILYWLILYTIILLSTELSVVDPRYIGVRSGILWHS